VTQKPKTLTWWKKKAWSQVSQYVRRSAADFQGYVSCVTCGTKKHWKEMHAGHFIDSRNNTVLFDARLIHPQCFRCNSKQMGCLAGNKIQYVLFMKRTYGYTDEQIEEFDRMKFQSKKITIFDCQEIIDDFTDKLIALDLRDGNL
jgi:hypothetical protein